MPVPDFILLKVLTEIWDTTPFYGLVSLESTLMDTGIIRLNISFLIKKDQSLIILVIFSNELFIYSLSVILFLGCMFEFRKVYSHGKKH